MEIKNNVTNVNPPAENQAQPSEKGSSKSKKAQGVQADFDASLIASLLSQAQAKSSVEMPAEAATKVELSGKDSIAARSEGQAEMQKAASQKLLKAAGALNQAQAAAASAEGAQPVQFTDEKTLIKTQAAMNANGTMTDAFVAGPNQPWNPNWVFGAADRAEIAQKMEGSQGQSPLAGAMAELQRLASEAQGGDAKQISQAGERLNQELGMSLGQLKGEVQSMDLPKPEGQSQALNRVGGEAFLSLLQGNAGQAGGELGSGLGNGSGSQNPDADPRGTASTAQQQAQALLNQTGSTTTAGGLHVIEGGRSTPFGMAGLKEEGKLSPEMLGGGAAPLALHAGPERAFQPQAPVLTGHVVPGSMMKDRLTNETLLNMTNTLSNISARGGNGEMRIRMNPGNLGELMIKVSTQGNRVDLKVQASDTQAKMILEESLNSLKDGLSNQNLSLSRVDITVAQAGNSSQSGDSQSQQQSQHGSMNFDGRGAQFQENGGTSGGNDSRGGGDNAPVDLRAARARAALASSLNSSNGSAARDASGRLNVIA